MKFIWGVLCSRVITDSQTNTVSYIDCIEEIKAAKLPVHLNACQIGTLWEKTEEGIERLKLRILAETPSGQSKPLVETRDLEVAKERHRLNFLLEGFPVDEEGKYKFKLDQLVNGEWKFVFEFGFKVNVDKSLFEKKPEAKS